jgi:hypothetical protein
VKPNHTLGLPIDRETAVVKSILVGVIAAIGLAATAAVVLDREFQRNTEQRFQTEGVRL